MDENYNDLRSLFDLPERFQALEYKLQLIQQTLELLVDTSRDRRLLARAYHRDPHSGGNSYQSGREKSLLDKCLRSNMPPC